ncbi:MAG: ATP-dependent RecD-like DNA helicase, partial [bacterium]|nr:ATP-dependent RecD-like DNA helicase [bacterium]
MIHNSQALEDVEGEVRNIVYYDEETHFCIATFKPKVGSPITVKGTLVRAQKGELMRLSGSWISDARFGKQFKIKYFQMIKPDSLIGIRKYLGSGLIPGIG